MGILGRVALIRANFGLSIICGVFVLCRFYGCLFKFYEDFGERYLLMFVFIDGESEV